MLHTRNLPQFLATSDVRYWVYQVGRHGRRKKADLNWKLKISNMANNADISQSQARDTRHHRMQIVDSLCTNSGLLQAEYCIVGTPNNTAIQLATVVHEIIINC